MVGRLKQTPKVGSGAVSIWHAFETWRVIKAHALADFLAETSSNPSEAPTVPIFWNLYVDGSSTKDESGASLIIETPRVQGTSMA